MARFKNEGSVLRETVQAEGLGMETRCEITSDESPKKSPKSYAMPRRAVM